MSDPVASPPDEFEEAADAVSNSTMTVEKEIKKYPIVPIGSHKGICTKAEIREGTFGDQLSLTWKLETKFKDDSGDEKDFLVFDNLGLSFGEKARLACAFKELTAESIAPLAQEKKIKRGGKEFLQSTFDSSVLTSAFMGMEATLVVIHKPGKKDPSKMYARIVSYTCSPEQIQKNSSLVFTDGPSS